MRAQDADLTPKQEVAIAALLSCPTIKQAAESARVGESTLLRWMTLPRFRDRYETERRLLFEGARNQIRQAAGGAVATLVTVQNDPDSPANARVSAAKAVLEFAMRVHEADDILERLQRLEESTGGKS